MGYSGTHTRSWSIARGSLDVGSGVSGWIRIVKIFTYTSSFSTKFAKQFVYQNVSIACMNAEIHNATL